jgi:phytoene desaturase
VSAPRVVVIGAGLGGLAAGIRLAARGFHVTVVEKRGQAGGRAGVFISEGFTFDTGPTVITAPFLLDELWAVAGRRREDDLELIPVDPFYRLRFHDGSTLDYRADPAAMAEAISAFSPEDVDGYERFVRDSKAIYEVGFERLADVPFDSLWSMLRIVPKMVQLRSFQSVYAFVSRYVRDERLRILLSFHPLLVGGNPFTTTSIYTLITFLERNFGIWFPRGGTYAMVEAMTALFESLGGELRTGAEVTEIAVERGRATGVRLAGGARLPAEWVVSNGDPAYVYRKLLPPDARGGYSDERLDRMRYSMGLAVVYLGAYRTWPELAQHTIVFGPRYRELLDDLFEGTTLPEDFSLYLHAPTRTDATLAPPGGETLYALVPVPNLRANIDWDIEGPRLRERILDRLEETCLPGLRASLATQSMVTPVHFRDELLAAYGAGFSIQPILTQSAWFRFHNRAAAVPNLLFVGAGTHPGAGVPGVLSSAKVVDRLIPDDGVPGNARDPIAGTHA